MVTLYKPPPGTASLSLRGQRGDVPCPGPHGQGGAALGFNLRLCAWGDPGSLCSELSVPSCAQGDTCPHTRDRGEDQRDAREACSTAANTAVNNGGVLMKRPGSWMVVLGEGSEGGMGVQPSLDYVGSPKPARHGQPHPDGEQQAFPSPLHPILDEESSPWSFPERNRPLGGLGAKGHPQGMVHPGQAVIP